MSTFDTKATTLTLDVPGMHCANCEKRVSAILESIPGVASVAPSSERGNVVIGLDASSPASEQTVRDELAAGGYTAE